ncbi:MAG: hypothetical protein WC602_00340 [archaeon]
MNKVKKVDVIEKKLTRASHSLGIAWDDLRVALNKAGDVESIVLLSLIKRTSELQNEVDGLLSAHNADRDRIIDKANKKQVEQSLAGNVK